MRQPTLTDRRTPRSLRGNNLVEFAMVLPILLMMFMGVFDFGWVLHQQIALDNATREGARRGAIGATDAQIKTKMQAMTPFTITNSEIVITVVDANGTVQTVGSRIPDNIIQVKVTRNNLQLITPIRAFVSAIGTINLKSEARFIIE